jgi:hypothetical protein
MLSPLTQSRDITIAVESIDGPPREVAQKLISDLNAEGVPLKIGVVGPEAEATYRMRGYLATHAAGSLTAVAWAWDVYDASLNHAVRVSGEERVAGAGGKGAAKSGAMADEALLRRIAHSGMDQLAAFMAAPPAAPAPPPIPAAPVPETVASRDDGSGPTAPAFAGTPRLAEASARR